MGDASQDQTATAITDTTKTADDLAAAILRIDEGMRAMLRSGLKERAIHLLLQSSTGVSMTDIRKVLDGLHSLRSTYLTK